MLRPVNQIGLEAKLLDVTAVPPLGVQLAEK